MSRGLKIIVIIAGVVVLLAAITWGVWTWFTRQAIPKTSGNIRLEGLSQPVDIVRDQYGVAHIYAHTTEDLFFAEGYVHAQERFWQMEFQRRTASGRLSEVFGEATVSTDKYLRHYGFHELAQQAYDQMGEDTRRVIDAYTAGVNAYIARRRPGQLGLEFAFLGVQGVDVEIEPWTPADSLAWAEMMVFDQSSEFYGELRNIDLLSTVGQEWYELLNPPYREDRPVIIPEGSSDVGSSETDGLSPALSQAEIDYLVGLAAKMRSGSPVHEQLADLGIQLTGGSNSFVVSGERTTTGSPILANDPHMGVMMPALWYQVGMHCIEKSSDCVYNFRGVSLPGVPGILIGHNDRIAWGLTNAAFDAEDVFIERINPQNPNQYEVNGKWVDMEIRREEIVVRGQDEPEVIFVRKTRNGLIVDQMMGDDQPYSFGADGPELYALSFAWTALEPVRSVEAVLKVLGAQNWDQFVDALQYFDAGKQNWLYADVDGNIGYVLPGKIPVRAKGDGTLPVPGWNDEYRWTGFIPYDEMPRSFNPEQGFIATANNPQLRLEDYPYLLGMSQYRGQRAQRITEMIRSDKDGLSIEDMIAIQTDNKSLSAMEVMEYLKGLKFDDEQMEITRNWLLNWDYQMTKDSPQAALYNLFWVRLIANTFYDQLPEDNHPNGKHVTSDTVYLLLQEPDHTIWDDVSTGDVVEGRDDILVASFEQAYADGVEKFGKNLDGWSWGELHTITFQNATLGRSGIGFIENIFNRGPFTTSGSEAVVQKTCWSLNKPADVNCIPAMRQVVDLGDLSNTRIIHSVGQSGHPMDAHYDDLIDLWRNFQYIPTNWTRQQAEASKAETLVLQPR